MKKNTTSATRILFSVVTLLLTIQLQAQKVQAKPHKGKTTRQQKSLPHCKRRARPYCNNSKAIFVSPSTVTKGSNYIAKGQGFEAGFSADGIWYNQQGTYDNVSKTQHGYAWQVTFANASKNLQPELAQTLSFPVHNYREGVNNNDSKAYKEMWYRNVYAGTDACVYNDNFY